MTYVCIYKFKIRTDNITLQNNTVTVEWKTTNVLKGLDVALYIEQKIIDASRMLLFLTDKKKKKRQYKQEREKLPTCS